ncbi:MAG TPA: helix-hairpin-helix domain-containing protein [Candidatus Polarisedimenticolaceae bacterium]|nr:helix-hairpin-helix domain-containing protein [Candidatus Polarisedimenticolaceae bacterium]
MKIAKNPLVRRAAAVLAVVSLAAAVAAAPSGSADSTETPRPPAAKIDLNQATQEQLESIPGIGPALAKRILDFRTKEGKFLRVDDLLKVRGIGEKSLEKLRPYVTVEPRA